MPELPVSTIVIVVLCVIVLLAVAALLLGVWNPFKDQTNMEVAKNNACQMLVNTNCYDPESIPITNFDANKDGTLGEQGGISSWVYADNCGGSGGGAAAPPAPPGGPPAPPSVSGDNLATLCLCWYGRTSPTDCKNLCGCS
jgi:hypothetical protein